MKNCAFSILLLFSVSARIFGQQSPNIVYILADDMGYGDVGVYNSSSLIPTPHMNRLAAEGMRFTDAHSASSVCTPSRYAILTGRYAWRSKLKSQVFYNYEPPLIELSRLTVAGFLKNNGYHTAAIGKWHLGLNWESKAGQSFDFGRPFPWPGGTLQRAEESKIDFTKPVTGGPNDLGFDYFYGVSACATCNTPYCYIENRNIEELPTQYYDGKYLEQRSGFRSPGFDETTVDSLFTVKAVKYIEQNARSKKPFFLYLAASSPHEPAEEAVVPKFMRGVSKAGARGDLVAYFDWMVGQVVASLKKQGLFENTIVIVSSDNGAKPGDLDRITYGHKSSGELKGFKGGVWEGGHRVPLIIRWPEKIKPNSVNSGLVGLQDLMATLSEILQVPLPEGAGEDSKSFLGSLLNRQNGRQNFSVVRSDMIMHSTAGVFVVRKDNWKLVVNCDNSGDGGRGVFGNKGTGPSESMLGQLYNLADDPSELYNLISKNREKADELLQILDRQK